MIDVEAKDGVAENNSNVDEIIAIMHKRLSKFGVKEAILQKQANRIIIQLSFEKQPDRIIGLITRPAVIEFKLVDEKYASPNYKNSSLPAMYEKRFMIGSNQQLVVRKKASMDNRMLADVEIQFDSFSNEPYLQLEFTAIGADVFREITGSNIRKKLAILIDGKIYTAPVIQSEIPGGRARITGGFSMEEVSDFEIMFKYGPFPESVKLIEKRKLTESLWLGRNPSQDMLVIQKGNLLVEILKNIGQRIMHMDE